MSDNDEELESLSSKVLSLFHERNRNRERLVELCLCVGWSVSPYRLCDHYCNYCITGVNGPSEPLMPVDRMVDELRRGLAEVPDGAALALGASSDPYPRSEAQLGITRALLPTLLERNAPLAIVTKGTTVLRDLDLLRGRDNVSVVISMCTVDEEAARRLEPFAPSPAQRIAAVNELNSNGVSAMVAMIPWIPGVSDVQELVERLPNDTLISVSPLHIGFLKRSVDRFEGVEDQDSIYEAYLAEFRRVGTLANVEWRDPNYANGTNPLAPLARGRLYREHFRRQMEHPMNATAKERLRKSVAIAHGKRELNACAVKPCG